jgi:glycosyltransferase involved in cell wall biosynthesis
MALPKVLIFTPTYDKKDYCIDAFVENALTINYPNKHHIIVDNSPTPEYSEQLKKRLAHTNIEVYHVPRGKTTREALARAQNFGRRMAIDGGYDYMLSLESDIFCPPDVIQRLMRWAKPVVTGIYMIGDKERDLFLPCVTLFRYVDSFGMLGTRLLGVEGTKEEKNQTMNWDEIEEFMKQPLQQVAAGGMGVCLMDIEILKKIPFMFELGLDGHSDIYWFNDCFRNKTPVFVDTTVQCDHDFSDWNAVKDR